MDSSRANVTLSRRIHPSMENTAMYMWSRTKTWLRSMDRRSRYSGRSWCAMVAIDACSLATWDSRAIVTLSRKRRCMRVLTVRRNQVAAADTPSPIDVASTSPARCSNTPLPSSINHSARSASGRAASCDSTSDANISRGSRRYPSLHNRHMDDSAGGSGSIACPRLGEDVIGRALLVGGNVKPLRLQVEHRSVAPSERHEFVVCAELNHPSVFKHTDAIRVTYGGKSMRDEDGGRVPRRCQQTVENLRLSTHVELRRGLVEQHHGGAQPHGRQCPRKRDPLPLSAGQVCTAGISTRKHGVERSQVRGACRFEGGAHNLVWSASRRNIVAERQFQPNEILKHSRNRGTPRCGIELPKIHAVDLNPAGLGVVEPAE